MNLLQKLRAEGLIKPPKWLPDNLQYLTSMGSHAYGVARKGKSDFDMYGMVIPPKHILFPHQAGVLWDYDNNFERFSTWQEHHIQNPDENKPQEWDFAVWSIVKYFKNLRDASPNVIDSLFTSQDCISHCTELAFHVRANRNLFLSQKLWHSFTGYAYSQLRSMNKHEGFVEYVKWAKENKIPLELTYEDLLKERKLHRAKMFSEMDLPGIHPAILKLACKKLEKIDVPTTKRIVDLIEYGYDLKFAYHLVRLMLEVEQLIEEQDLDLRRNSEILKDIRDGNWTKERVLEFFQTKEKLLMAKKENTKLPYKPDEQAIKTLLLECMEMHYGNLGPDLISSENKYLVAISQIQNIVNDI